VLLFNALASAEDPARALCEASRVLRPSGQLSIVTLDAHGNLESTAAYGHVQPGFAPSALREMLVKAGLRVVSCELSTRERRPPRFGVVSAFAEKPSAGKTAGGDPLSSTESIADG
jgi:ubiquinone/menaquinone biosynthesis C-methylase UbiE